MDDPLKLCILKRGDPVHFSMIDSADRLAPKEEGLDMSLTLKPSTVIVGSKPFSQKTLEIPIRSQFRLFALEPNTHILWSYLPYGLLDHQT